MRRKNTSCFSYLISYCKFFIDAVRYAALIWIWSEFYFFFNPRWVGNARPINCFFLLLFSPLCAVKLRLWCNQLNILTWNTCAISPCRIQTWKPKPLINLGSDVTLTTTLTESQTSTGHLRKLSRGTCYGIN